MSNVVYAFDYLADPKKYPIPPVCLLVGDEHFFRRRALLEVRHAVLGGAESEFSLTEFTGDKRLDFRDVVDELSTVAMFGGDKRLVVVEDADAYFSTGGAKKKTAKRGKAADDEETSEGEADSADGELGKGNREKLEAYAARPSKRGVLVVEFKTCASNTKIYKAVAETGLIIRCSIPESSKENNYKTWDRIGWLMGWTKQAYGVKLDRKVADKLIEMVGDELGLLDQEASKLAQFVGPDKVITADLVDKLSGSWRVKTVWTLVDAVLEGKTADAMQQLDRLLTAGEEPVGVLAQLSFTLRRLAAATRLALQMQESGKRVDLTAALGQVGVHGYFVKKSAEQLKHLTRHRGKLIYQWLLQADLDLKGASALPPRLILERLLLRLAVPYEQ